MYVSVYILVCRCVCLFVCVCARVCDHVLFRQRHYYSQSPIQVKPYTDYRQFSLFPFYIFHPTHSLHLSITIRAVTMRGRTHNTHREREVCVRVFVGERERERERERR